jgi:hypothetical protein
MRVSTHLDPGVGLPGALHGGQEHAAHAALVQHAEGVARHQVVVQVLVLW